MEYLRRCLLNKATQRQKWQIVDYLSSSEWSFSGSHHQHLFVCLFVLFNRSVEEYEGNEFL